MLGEPTEEVGRGVSGVRVIPPHISSSVTEHNRIWWIISPCKKNKKNRSVLFFCHLLKEYPNPSIFKRMYSTFNAWKKREVGPKLKKKKKKESSVSPSREPSRESWRKREDCAAVIKENVILPRSGGSHSALPNQLPPPPPPVTGKVIFFYGPWHCVAAGCPSLLHYPPADSAALSRK